MPQSASDLQQLKGVGNILVQRFKEAGFDSFAKVAQASGEELGRIKGLNARNIPSIQEQARLLEQAEPEDGQKGLELILERRAEVLGRVQALAEAARDRFPEKIDGKCGRKLAGELVSIGETLTQLNLMGKKSVRRAGKALAKVEKRLAELTDDASLKKVQKTFKRARKAAQKTIR